MNDSKKSKPQLIAELKELREKVKKFSSNENHESFRLTGSASATEVDEELERLRNILVAIPHCILDPEGTILSCNTAYNKILGYEDGDLTGTSLLDRAKSEEERKSLKAFLSMMAKDQPPPKPYFTARKTKEGGTIEIQVDWNYQRNQEGQLIGFSSVLTDITARMEAEKKLRESQVKYRDLVEGSLQGICVHRDWKFLFFNDEFAKIFDYSPSELKEKSWEMLIPPQEQKRMKDYRERRLKGEENVPENYEFEAIRKGGGQLWLTTFAKVVMWEGISSVQSTIYDITNRRMVEIQLRQAQKMDAVGQLAGGVAHDFNNMLHIIQGYGELALRSIQNNGKRKIGEDLEKMLHAAGSASEITGQLLAFSRQQVLRLTGLDVNDVIENLMKMLARLIGEDVDLRVLPGKDAGYIQGDRVMLEQVLMNLCVNARDAMPNGGRMIIETTWLQADEAFCVLHEWAKPGGYAVISVSDNGNGVAKENVQRIFEPFFTTKESGKGTGLGLSVVYGIIQQHGGHISIYSEMGMGTTFKIFLPSSDDPVNSAKLPKTPPMVGGKETILIAEDDPSVLELMVGALNDMGYTVLTAKNGEDACKVFDANAGAINLALLDVIMPKMSGKAVYHYIHQVKPSLPVLFSTGYTANAIDSDFMAKSGLKLLQKPYSPTTLLRMVRDALDFGH